MVSKRREEQSGSGAWAFCSLNGDERLQRLALVRAKVMPHVRRQEELGDGFAWECADDPMSRAHIEELVRLERACCGGLQLTLRDLPERAAIRFETRGPGLPAAQLDALRSLGRVGATAGLAGAGAAATAAVSAGGAALICCVVPWVLAAAGGVGAGRALAALDSPWVMIPVALVIGLSYRLLARRNIARRLGRKTLTK